MQYGMNIVTGEAAGTRCFTLDTAQKKLVKQSKTPIVAIFTLFLVKFTLSRLRSAMQC
jgi:hypothetical protein